MILGGDHETAPTIEKPQRRELGLGDLTAGNSPFPAGRYSEISLLQVSAQRSR